MLLASVLTFAVVAVGNADATEVVLRIVNYGSALNVTIDFEDVISPDSVTIDTLQGVTGADYEQV